MRMYCIHIYIYIYEYIYVQPKNERAGDGREIVGITISLFIAWRAIFNSQLTLPLCVCVLSAPIAATYVCMSVCVSQLWKKGSL